MEGGMLKTRYVGAAFVFAVLALAVCEVKAIPTNDPADIAGTTNIVKSGADNLKGIKGITEKAGKLNSIVGDAAGTLSRYQEKYGNKIKEKMDKAKKLNERRQKAMERYNKYKGEVEKRKAQYQSVMDKAAEINDEVNKGINKAKDGLDKAQDFKDKASKALDTAAAFRDKMRGGKDGAGETAVEDSGTEEYAGAESYAPEPYNDVEGAGGFPQITSAGRVYNDSDVVADNEDVYENAASDYEDSDLDADSAEYSEDAEDKVMTRPMRKGFVMPAQAERRELKTSQAQVEKESSEDSQAGGTQPAVRPMRQKALQKVSPNLEKQAVAQPAVRRMQLKNFQKDTLTPKLEAKPAESARPTQLMKENAPVKKFRVSPRTEKVSSLQFNQTVAFAAELAQEADAAETTASGNPEMGDKTVFPYAILCGGDAKEYVEDENKQKECIEKLIRNNNTENHIEAAANMADCNKMVYKTLLAMLAESTSSKAKSAAYPETLEQQKEDSAKSTQLRDDLAVLGMSIYQTQLLLNEMSLNLSSQLLLYSAQQICQAKKDVLDDQEDTATGEK